MVFLIFTLLDVDESKVLAAFLRLSLEPVLESKASFKISNKF